MEFSKVTAPRLSALVVAHNEEAQLADCLESLRFADEVVVVLDKCTDGSKPIAERYADRLIEGSWDLQGTRLEVCLLYTSPSPRDRSLSRMPSSA